MATDDTAEEIMGFRLLRGRLSRAEQVALVEELRGVVAEAPLIRPVTAWGKPMSVRMSAAGRLGWVIDRGRYAYADRHPETGAPWPAMPARILDLWRDVSGWQADPDCCLINWYAEGARMGLHRDADEGESAYAAPVVSLSLGDPALFRMGGPRRRDPTRSTWLASGDVVVMGGAARLAHHGVDRIRFGTDPLLAGGGRINLTLRVVHAV